MAKATAPQIMAKIDASSTVLVPLEIAHQIQALLAQHAVKYNCMYRGREASVVYITDYEVPSVSVVSKDAPIYDAMGLTREQVDAWYMSVRDGEGPTVIEPKQFTAIAGD